MFAEAYKTDDGLTIELHSDVAGVYHLYQRRDDGTETDLGEGQGAVSRFPWQEDFERQVAWFFLRFPDGRELKAGFRILPIAGMYNFRDMGGYQNSEGRTMRWGKLYRGDHLYNMKEEGYPLFRSVGLRTIIDFRRLEECRKYPNQYAGIPVQEYHFVPEADIAALAGSIQNGESRDQFSGILEGARKQAEMDPQHAAKSMCEQQRLFVTDPNCQKAFADTLHVVARGDAAPLYFHCKGGKDRTGYAGMLIMSLLGIDEEQIMYDYLLTARARRKKNQRYLEHFREMAEGDETVAQYMYALFDTRSEYLQAAIDEIHAHWGTVTEYCQTVLGISPDEITRMQELYLEQE